eukprot:TRINITY_DN5794_c0_g1_i1.p2 TRINITY_DN5794_c0_g1~~TRINITY_DN5794_c0_g1_i1.p2  ORF type:complete len:153 (+),score=34.62 TRINITY_DN5794_c0_g1_i1:81-539(+)
MDQSKRPTNFAAARSVLGVAHDATQQEVRAAYYRLAKQLHPDVAGPGNKERAEVQFRRIADAYRLLSSSQNCSGNFYKTSAATAAAAARSSTGGAATAAASALRRGSFWFYAASAVPFLLPVGGVVCFGLWQIGRSYQKAKGDSPSFHPFLP